jgi:hypothetical protein
MGKPVVPYIACPLHSDFGQHFLNAAALWRGATTRQLNIVASPSRNSVLPENFNGHLCSALNMREERGVTHFALLHGDVVPQTGWFDILYDELCTSKADIISAVVPIKSIQGQTTTAIGERLPNGKPSHIKLTMHDIYQLPPTFGIEDTPWPDKALLVNTGCMAFALDSPWVIDFVHSGGFGFDTWIDEHDGVFTSSALSEDWRMSLWAHEHGVRCMATRKVEVNHWGMHAFGNMTAWGNPERNAIKAEEVPA